MKSIREDGRRSPDAFGFRGLWVKWRECHIEDGLIISGAKPVAYDLGKYFRDPLEVRVVDYILGEKRKESRDYYVHHIFASLSPDNLNQIARWHRILGPLYYDNHELPKQKILAVHAMNKGFELTKFRAEQMLFRWVLNSCISLQKEGMGDSEPAVPGTLLECVKIAGISGFEDKYRLWADNEISKRILLVQLITHVVEHYLPNVRPTIRWKEVSQSSLPSWDWEYSNLISALYFMLFAEITRGFPHRCANDKCGRYFRPIKHNSTLYCSATCKNRVDQRKNKDRKREVRKLLKAGKTIKEIAKLTGATEDKILEWNK